MQMVMDVLSHNRLILGVRLLRRLLLNSILKPRKLLRDLRLRSPVVLVDRAELRRRLLELVLRRLHLGVLQRLDGGVVVILVDLLLHDVALECLVLALDGVVLDSWGDGLVGDGLGLFGHFVD